MAPAGAGHGDHEPAVWHRIPPRHFPKKPHQDRPDSSAFDDTSDTEAMSAVLTRPERDPTDIIAGHDGYGVVALTVTDREAQGQRIVADPRPDEPDHVLVVGPKTQARRRAMARYCQWVIRPPEAYPQTG